MTDAPDCYNQLHPRILLLEKQVEQQEHQIQALHKMVEALYSEENEEIDVQVESDFAENNFSRL